MKNFLFLLLFLTFTSNIVSGQIDSLLYKKISKMYQDDQKWRIEFSRLYSKGKSDYSEKQISRNWKVIDSLNLIQAKEIVAKHGFPGFSLVGKSGSSKFWAIIQHCDEDVKFQQKVLKFMRLEVLKKNADGIDYAYLTDRVLVNTNQKQLYGTQTRLNIQTKEYVPLPIRDELTVDKRRISVGLNPLSEYLKSLIDVP